MTTKEKLEYFKRNLSQTAKDIEFFYDLYKRLELELFELNRIFENLQIDMTEHKPVDYNKPCKLARTCPNFRQTP